MGESMCLIGRQEVEWEGQLASSRSTFYRCTAKSAHTNRRDCRKPQPYIPSLASATIHYAEGRGERRDNTASESAREHEENEGALWTDGSS